jgi:large repetitive protein
MRIRSSKNRSRWAHHRQQELRKGLRLERLESRMVLSGASPIAVNDLYETMVDEPLVVEAAGVLANDTDAEGDSLTAIEFIGPKNGELTLLSDGSFVYSPNPGFSGVDGFLYQADDGTSASNFAAVTIQVISPNVPPVGANDAYTVDEDGVLTVMAESGVLINDLDVDGDPLTAELIDGPINGTLEFNADGSFTYTPDPDFHGTDAFTYVALDAEASSELILVEITVNAVNDAPVGANDAYTVDEDGVLTVMAESGVLINDLDVDGDPLTAELIDGPINGTLEFNADGSFTYTPDPDFHGTDAFTYVALDAEASSELILVEITVNAVNDAPVGANDAYTVDEDGVLTVMAESGVLINDLDVDGDPLTAELVDGPINGTLEFNADGSFTYTPDPDFHGTDAFTYVALDAEASSELILVEITVNAVNDAPVGANDAYTVDEDGVLTVMAESGVLINDLDVDGDPLTAELVDGPINGTLEFNADGSFTYTPDPDFHGTDAFTYVALDAEASSELILVEITVNAVNDAPVVRNDRYTVDEDETLEVALPGVLSNDFDPDGDPLTAELIDEPVHGELQFNADGSFTYVPNADFNGTDAFTYRVSDGSSMTDLGVVEINVLAVNDAPVALDDEYTAELDTPLVVEAPGVLSNDSDVDGDTLIAVLETGPENGTLELSEDGSFIYTPNAGFSGFDGFSYLASDGQSESLAFVSIVVNPGALPPEANNDSYTAIAGQTLMVDVFNGVLANDVDPNGDPLEAILFRGPKHGTLTLNADGSFAYTTSGEYTGIDSFIYRATDGELESQLAVVTLHVSAGQPDDDSSAGLFTRLAGKLDGAFDLPDLGLRSRANRLDQFFADLEESILDWDWLKA